MPHLSRSLKVIGTNTDQSATYDFLLLFPGNYRPILYCFWDIGQYLPNFPSLIHLTPLLRGFALEFCNGSEVLKKTRSTPLTDCQKVWYVHSFTHDSGIGRTDRIGKTISCSASIAGILTLTIQSQSHQNNRSTIWQTDTGDILVTVTFTRYTGGLRHLWPAFSISLNQSNKGYRELQF